MNESDTDTLLELAHGYIEGRLTPAQVTELETLLAGDPEARRLYLDFLHDHATLHWDHITQDGIDETLEDFPPLQARRFPTAWQALAAAAMVSLLALVIVSPGAKEPSFAVMKKTESARWESGTLPTAEGARLGPGDLELASGLATISFDSGAEVVLEAPARLTLVDAMNCILEGGTVVAEVGPSAKGFAIRTPSARVIDHGTSFAVNVDAANGATQTQVFDGLVEVELPDRSERIELRKGQKNLVEGTQLGQVSEGLDEATWAPTQGGAVRQDKNTLTLTTADPGGADAYASATKTSGHDSETLLLLKNGINENAPHRKSYLRFDLGAIAPGQISSARLDLHFAPTGWGLASHLGDSEFTVYGITDDHLDEWTSGALDWATAPANVISSGTALDPEKVSRLGTFTIPRGVQSGTYGLTGETLAAFLNQDVNRRATLVIVRNTSEVRGGGLVHAFASARHATLPPPTLSLRVVE